MYGHDATVPIEVPNLPSTRDTILSKLNRCFRAARRSALSSFGSTESCVTTDVSSASPLEECQLSSVQLIPHMPRPSSALSLRAKSLRPRLSPLLFPRPFVRQGQMVHHGKYTEGKPHTSKLSIASRNAQDAAQVRKRAAAKCSYSFSENSLLYICRHFTVLISKSSLIKVHHKFIPTTVSAADSRWQHHTELKLASTTLLHFRHEALVYWQANTRFLMHSLDQSRDLLPPGLHLHMYLDVLACPTHTTDWQHQIPLGSVSVSLFLRAHLP